MHRNNYFFYSYSKLTDIRIKNNVKTIPASIAMRNFKLLNVYFAKKRSNSYCVLLYF